MTAGEFPLEITSNHRISTSTTEYKMEGVNSCEMELLLTFLVISAILTVYYSKPQHCIAEGEELLKLKSNSPKRNLEKCFLATTFPK